MIGPWAHGGISPEGKVGDVVFGKQAVFDLTETTLEWFDYVFKGAANEYATKPPIRLFTMGENVWRYEKEFPLKREKETRYFLHSRQGANSIRGDGSLSMERPFKEKPDEFQYDPHNPVPTLGGRLCCGRPLTPGPFNQQSNESRSDVLVYSTPPLSHDTEVTGYVSVELYAATSATDTDFTAMLADVDSSGYARYVTDGIVRARYRDSTLKAQPSVPSQTYRYTIDLWATSNLFKAGHRMRLYVSSSNFPRFSRNLNTGKPTAGDREYVTAKQTIYHEQLYPSALVVPIIPRSDSP
jgi:putative CocE/NonD family hydrolase